MPFNVCMSHENALFQCTEVNISQQYSGNSYIEFSNGASFDSDISTKSVPYPQKALCAVTGLPAKYSDEHSSGGGMMAMGNLYDSIIGQGFAVKKKRSSVLHEEATSDTRYLRRFCRIPAADNLLENEVIDYLETTVDLNKVDSLIAGDCQHVPFDLLNFRVRPKLHGEVEIWLRSVSPMVCAPLSKWMVIDQLSLEVLLT
ncbi:hypothetical protein Cgig2_031213 [Carnegiea gigantea]|uniref:Uncharacterized protein n=1 Tax=Carnegiea gigantea TaxID=171969 RepID=A0A9Q1GKM3_9CARY|nr:hypothetical protein Cgig2_031213 [Carnegiea gigantea]